MNGVPWRDRLQPALLDRLIDDAPGHAREAVEARVLTRRQLRDGVLRDLNFLLNAQAGFEALRNDDRFARLCGSTLNFGIPPLSGTLRNSLELPDIERMLHRAIVEFEPRLLPDTLRVRALPRHDRLAHHNLLEFEITARLWAQPYPLDVLLRTALDLETGLASVAEGASSPGGSDRRPD